MSDLIDRQAAIDMKCLLEDWTGKEYEAVLVEDIEQLPSAEPEIKPIGYNDCSNAMMKMWMDNVVTDGEYNRIMDKLNAYWRAKDD